jgi:hypothetical protein
MPSLSTYTKLQTIALSEYADIVVNAQIANLSTGDALKLRLSIADGSLLDVFLSVSGRYSYHWERRVVEAGDLYRHDNAPHNRWRNVGTFPKHFHNGADSNVVEIYLSDQPEQAIRQFLSFVRAKLLSTPPATSSQDNTGA